MSKLTKPLRARIRYDGNWCVFPDRESFLGEIATFFDNAEHEDELQVEFIRMSDDEYEELEEFQGW